MNREFVQPEFRDLHADLDKLIASNFYNERALEALKAASDLIVAADVSQEMDDDRDSGYITSLNNGIFHSIRK